ncbi:conserved Plasmodium protein, unknown function [Plasmodium berghei]|uniref:Zinc finger protein, putative n=2 Tax=Plasmodium berghei TaxID=5821 RepID=A0A509AN80_PLABA|nr:zinc finger protein, putative [Plasmodium berghei ANKA]CXI54794.1 conserved Plasmodium protein, unknown function [Plasmodium berghei]SCL95045.1 conserved Plasmodium protein, unknown function [Plasmodium berghei]SCM16161.1 conserved Plasmodium protein, unknown function [Plasmodium berghei]SCM17957.1 conserved Plasmodium protein, unknown function [Plasmodium berghei]SCN26335.1 conserved Plasmodium protein, unknown function [Plasmodium berghei]|eukprot:XP_034422085.1 zinc finger protein, putative [Plasmodium berghei ANKA]
MIDTFIYWNFKGSKGSTNILRISLPCSYNTIKNKILEVANLNLQNSLDILLYHNNRVLNEYESIYNQMFIEVQRTSISVARNLLQNSNKSYLEKNKNVNPLNNNINDRSNVYDQNVQSKVNKYSQKYDNTTISSPISTPPINARNKPWNVYNRNSYGSIEKNNDDEDIKIQEIMESNNIYNSGYRGQINYYKKDKMNPNLYQHKLKRMPNSSNIKKVPSFQKGISGSAYNTMNNNAYNFSKTDNSSFFGGLNRQKQNNNEGYNKYDKNKTHHWSVNSYNNNEYPSSEANNEYIHPDYICHMCGKKGHSIKNCTMSAFNNNKKIKVPTGIPANFLTKINAEDIYKYDQIYILKDGSYGILKNVEEVSGSAYLYRSVDDKLNIYLGVNEKNKDENNNNNNSYTNNIQDNTNKFGSNLNPLNNTDNDSNKISNIYKCLLCKKLYTSPITLHCCGETYCKSCIFIYNKKNKNDYYPINSKVQSIKCPNCHKYVDTNELIINTNIKNVIDIILKKETTEDTLDKTNLDKNGKVFRENMNKTDNVLNYNNMMDKEFLNNSNPLQSHKTFNINTKGNEYNPLTNINEIRIGNSDENYNTLSYINNNMPGNIYSNNNNIILEKNNENNNIRFGFNPLINTPINLQELKKQHDFAIAYISKYKIEKGIKKKRKNVDLSMLLASKKVR